MNAVLTFSRGMTVFPSPGSSLGIVEPSVSMTHIADCINRSHGDTPGSKVVVVLENMVRIISLAVYNSCIHSFAYLHHLVEKGRFRKHNRFRFCAIGGNYKPGQ